jgi:hypothetical protein
MSNVIETVARVLKKAAELNEIHLICMWDWRKKRSIYFEKF